MLERFMNLNEKILKTEKQARIDLLETLGSPQVTFESSCGSTYGLWKVDDGVIQYRLHNGIPQPQEVILYDKEFIALLNSIV